MRYAMTYRFLSNISDKNLLAKEHFGPSSQRMTVLNITDPA